MPREEGQGCLKWPGLLILPSSSFLRAVPEIPHGSSGLDPGAAGGGCLGPGPHTCPYLVSWAQGMIGGGPEEASGAKLEGASKLMIKGTALGWKAGDFWDGKRMMNRNGGRSPTGRESGIEGCECSVGAGQSQYMRKEGGSAELGRQV